jgi:hypothetical protein
MGAKPPVVIHMIPRMAGLPGYDRAAAAIWLHEKP